MTPTDKAGPLPISSFTGKALTKNLLKLDMLGYIPSIANIAICQKWYQYEAEARSYKIELWAHPNPMPPWEFRKIKSFTRRDNKTISAGVYRGNTKSFVFHQSTCEHFNCKNCTEIFQRWEDAISAG